MARIRSVHPGLFTDEAWVSCSPLARILYIGLWTDADDQGLFEWKPLQIKMRLLPGDASDAPSLLAELAAADLITGYEVSGKRYGAIKDFRKYQRPKKPNAIHPLPPELRDYVALSEASSEPLGDDDGEVGNQFPPDGEKSPQMEDGGGREGEEISDANASSVVGGPSDDVAEAVALWNEVAGRHGLPKAKTIDKTRRGAIRARLRDGGLEVWCEALAAVERSPHCRGENERGWRADIDFVCDPKSWRRLREGFYGGDDSAAPSAMPTFTGPADLRGAVVAECGEEFCLAYLDPCEWRDVPARALVPRTRLAAEKLRREAGAALGDVQIEERAA